MKYIKKIGFIPVLAVIGLTIATCGYGIPDHSWGAWMVTTPATQASPVGQETRICQYCAESEIRTGSFYYSIGQTGPGGGIIFYVADGQGGRPLGFTVEGHSPGFASYTAHYLEAAPANMATTLRWSTQDVWGEGIFINIPGTSREIGAGRRNTALILDLDITAPAALACVNYRGPNNLTDWFLPSAAELNELYINRTHVGNLGTGWYWSSSQFNDHNAWLQSFSDGWQYGSDEYNTHSVRAVRAF